MPPMHLKAIDNSLGTHLWGWVPEARKLVLRVLKTEKG